MKINQTIIFYKYISIISIMIFEKSTLIIIVFLFALLLNGALTAIFAFLDVKTETYIPPLLWFNALAIFFAILPERTGTVFETD